MRKLVQSLLFAAVVAAAGQAHADFYLVVEANNPQPALTRKEAVDLFMGRTRAFANGDFAQVFDLPRDDPKRAAFYLALTGWSMAQVNSYWSRLMFSGQNMPPKPLPDEDAMTNIVKHNPNALGWLSKEPVGNSLRTVLILKGAP